MICSHFFRSQAKLVLEVASMRERANSLKQTIAQILKRHWNRKFQRNIAITKGHALSQPRYQVWSLCVNQIFALNGEIARLRVP